MNQKMKFVVLGAVLAMAAQPVFAGEEAPPAAAKAKAPAAKAEAKKAAEPGVMIVETVQLKAKVAAVDAAKRQVTFEADGKSRTVTCGPEVKNFDQIKVGDQLKITYVDSTAVFLEKAGGAAGGSEVGTVSLAPKGKKPGVLVTDTVTLKAKVDAVDAKKRTLTITAPDGKVKTMKVPKSVKGLDKLKKGDDIVLKHTEALAVVIEAPKP